LISFTHTYEVSVRDTIGYGEFDDLKATIYDKYDAYIDWSDFDKVKGTDFFKGTLIFYNHIPQYDGMKSALEAEGLIGVKYVSSER
jgi:hypothetical protein